ncbi:LysR family transcriptional regulator [Marinisporobacter balticus]|uniref:DNA-binding transcriptional LysR family regulator n=1 Tax=Marinisporobacter balticus TaxID=2018667 RepID=A0A4R2KB50_9FIRM|nr:LysR family transcriptional regulator [Marinisporobacter balticus]TCO70014.1 DNA-binding transcriptional LysR family regulator [Marinisporobacter balticus]
MEFRQLKYFQMVCQLKNITKAAERLYVSQPSITNSIKNLEKELSIQLFDRSKKQFKLTTEGKIFLERVDVILKQLDDVISEMKDYKNLKKGLLSLGVPPIIGTILFPKLFANFKKIYPNIELQIAENGSVTSKEMLEKGEIDLSIMIVDQSCKLLDTMPILDSEIFVCLNKKHPLSTKKKLKLEDLKNEPIIMLKEGFYHRKKIFEHFKKSNIEPNIILSSNQLDTIKSLVINGIGISFLLKETVENNEHIASIPLDQSMPIKIALAWKKDNFLSMASKTFIDFVKTSPLNQNTKS